MKTIGKILLLGVAVIMCLGIFWGCTNDYEYKETDFRLTISVDKVDVAVGDIVTVTVTFENLSGRDIPIKLSPWDTREKHEIKDLIQIGLFPENVDYGFAIYDLGGRMGRKTIKKDMIVQQTMAFVIEEQIDHEAAAAIIFYVGKDYTGKTIYSEIQTITVI